MKRIGLLSDTHSFWDPKYLEYFEECDTAVGMPAGKRR